MARESNPDQQRKPDDNQPGTRAPFVPGLYACAQGLGRALRRAGPGPRLLPAARSIGWASSTSSEFLERRTSADLAFINQGITFSVYSDRRGTEKIFPFDLIPRPVCGKEWDRLEAGLIQRIRALNLFLDDVYHDQRILKEGVIPANLVLESKGFRPEMVGFSPPGKQYVHVVGTDLIRDAAAASSWCSRTMAAAPRASATCSRTGW